MSEVKIFQAPNGENFIFWRNQLVNIKTARPRGGRCQGEKEFPDTYNINPHGVGFTIIDFLTEAERDDAYDELLTLLEQAKKQIAEEESKKSEIEAARELLSDGKRVRLYTEDYVVGKTRFFIFQSRGIGVSDDCDCKVGEINTRDGVFRFTVAGRVHVFRTRKKAEKMRNKFIDMLARAKAQLLLEEVDSNV